MRAGKEGSTQGLSPWLIDGYHFPVSFHIVIPLCVSV